MKEERQQAGAQSAELEEVIAKRMELERRLKSGANWFYWIAALSVINSIIIATGRDWGFVIGLGITQVAGWMAVDAVEAGSAQADVAIGVALVVNLIAVAGCVMLGIFANRRKQRAFVIGMVLYGLDGLMFLAVGDYLSFGFHIFALWCIYGGLRALRNLNAVLETRDLGTVSAA